MSVTRRVVTSADVRDASTRPERRIALSAGDLVTPLARDDAAQLDVTLVVDSNGPTTNGDSLEATVRRIVTSIVQGDDGVRRPVTRVDGRSVQMQLFPFPGPDPTMDCRLADVITAEQHHAPMAAGFMSLHTGSFPWNLDYDEIEYVIEGELHIGTQTGTVVGRPGDVLYVPKGSTITFGTPSWAKFLYVTHPADWAGDS